MTSPEKQLETMLANIPEKTGKTIEAWIQLIGRSDAKKHGQIVKMLKSEHGVTHGFARLIASRALEPEQPIDFVGEQYRGAKSRLKPVYDEIVSYALSLGDSVEIAPKKASVSLRSRKQFALIVPAARERIDLGLNIKGVEVPSRLEPYNAMCSHRIRLFGVSDFDDEVRFWLSKAFMQAA